jgi:hypothetical protein
MYSGKAVQSRKCDLNADDLRLDVVVCIPLSEVRSPGRIRQGLARCANMSRSVSTGLRTLASGGFVHTLTRSDVATARDSVAQHPV